MREWRAELQKVRVKPCACQRLYITRPFEPRLEYHLSALSCQLRPTGKSLFPLPSSLLPLPSSLFPLPSSLFTLPSSLFPLPSSLFPLPASGAPSVSSVLLAPSCQLRPVSSVQRENRLLFVAFFSISFPSSLFPPPSSHRGDHYAPPFFGVKVHFYH